MFLEFRPDFVERVRLAFCDRGERWLAKLPGLVERAAEKWGLSEIDPSFSAGWNLVARAKQGEEPVALKLVISDDEIVGENRALRHYDGDGVVRLLDEDRELRASLIEGADPGTPLLEREEEELIEVVISVLGRMLGKQDCPEGFPSIRTERKSFENGRGLIEDEMLREAVSRFDRLFENCGADCLIHGDFHPENVLYSECRGWLVIDPDGAICDREWDAATMARHQLWRDESPEEVVQNRVEQFTERLGLDRERLWSWAFVQAILSACWSIEDRDPGAEKAIWTAELLRGCEGFPG